MHSPTAAEAPTFNGPAGPPLLTGSSSSRWELVMPGQSDLTTSRVPSVEQSSTTTTSLREERLLEHGFQRFADERLPVVSGDDDRCADFRSVGHRSGPRSVTVDRRSALHRRKGGVRAVAAAMLRTHSGSRTESPVVLKDIKIGLRVTRGKGTGPAIRRVALTGKGCDAVRDVRRSKPTRSKTMPSGEEQPVNSGTVHLFRLTRYHFERLSTLRPMRSRRESCPR